MLTHVTSSLNFRPDSFAKIFDLCLDLTQIGGAGTEFWWRDALRGHYPARRLSRMVMRIPTWAAIWGGSAVMSFALPMVFGIVIAASSSVFIAAPILLFLGDWRRRRQ